MTRAIRLTIGLPPLAVLCLVGLLVEATDAALCALHPHTMRAFLRLRDWMDCPR